jgi:CheY-like chemotaxis protein
MELTLLLSVGMDSQLVNFRNVILESAGYTVVRAYSLNAALDCFDTLDFDLILLCQSFPAVEKELLTTWIRASGSRIPVVSISKKPGEPDAFADATVDNEPEALLKGMSEVLTKAAKSAAWSPSSSQKKDTVVVPPNVFAAAKSKQLPNQERSV